MGGLAYSEMILSSRMEKEGSFEQPHCRVVITTALAVRLTVSPIRK